MRRSPPPHHRVLSVGGLRRRRRRVYRERERERRAALVTCHLPVTPSDTPCYQHEQADERDRRGEHRHHDPLAGWFRDLGALCVKKKRIDTDVRAGIPFGPHAFVVLATERERGSQSDPAPNPTASNYPPSTRSPATRTRTHAPPRHHLRGDGQIFQKTKKGSPC